MRGVFPSDQCSWRARVTIPLVACPYFRPLARLAPARWSNPPRLSLLDAFDGLCEAGADVQTPDDTTLKECCNTGYARGRCARFPADAPWDAVRFTATGAGGFRYVFEKDYAPAESGAVETASGRLAAQASAFVEAWKRRPRKEDR